MHHVYLIEGKPKGTRYIGYTTDLKRRLDEHNRQKNVSTSKESSWKLIYCETYANKMDALGREKFLKSGSGWRFLKKQLTHYLSENSQEEVEEVIFPMVQSTPKQKSSRKSSVPRPPACPPKPEGEGRKLRRA